MRLVVLCFPRSARRLGRGPVAWGRRCRKLARAYTRECREVLGGFVGGGGLLQVGRVQPVRKAPPRVDRGRAAYDASGQPRAPAPVTQLTARTHRSPAKFKAMAGLIQSPRGAYPVALHSMLRSKHGGRSK